MKRPPAPSSGHRQGFFSGFAKKIAFATGHPITFLLALTAVLLWLVSGPLFDYSDTWQLIINTTTTIITFLMVFLIQNTQNRDSHAMQIKLDEIIRTQRGADQALLDLEELSDSDLEKVRARYEQLAEQARKQESKRGRKS